MSDSFNRAMDALRAGELPPVPPRRSRVIGPPVQFGTPWYEEFTRRTDAEEDAHEVPAWMAKPNGPGAQTVDELVARFYDLAGCPQLEKSAGEKCCEVCLYELGWLAIDLIPRLLARPEGASRG